jgi:hypothetical protein
MKRLIGIATFLVAAIFCCGCGSKSTVSNNSTPKTVSPQVKNSPQVQNDTTSSDDDQFIRHIEENEKKWHAVSRQNPNATVTTKHPDGSVTITPPPIILQVGSGQIIRMHSLNIQSGEDQNTLIDDAANWTRGIYSRNRGSMGGMGMF